MDYRDYCPTGKVQDRLVSTQLDLESGRKDRVLDESERWLRCRHLGIRVAMM